MAPPRPPPPPPLVDDLIGEILLLLPPDEPACLLRASLVCKSWRRLLSDPAFLRRYREFHRTPPLLGFLHNVRDAGKSRFVPTASPCSLPAPVSRSWKVLDCRHGRVLLHSAETMDLIVWDPLTGGQHHLDLPMDPYVRTSAVLWASEEHLAATVLCAADGCDHLDCHGGPSLVVFVDSGRRETWACVYSSEVGAWSAWTSIQLAPASYAVMKSSLLTGDALYFTMKPGNRILKYDLSRWGLSVIDLPLEDMVNMALITVKDGALGVANVEGHSLHLWSRRACSHCVADWVQYRVIELKTMLLPIAVSTILMVGFAEGADTILISTRVGVFTVEMKSGRIRKVSNIGCFDTLFPFVSFYAPDHASGRLASTGEDAVI